MRRRKTSGLSIKESIHKEHHSDYNSDISDNDVSSDSDESDDPTTPMFKEKGVTKTKESMKAYKEDIAKTVEVG
jgi:hypothetical protein